MNEGSLGSGRRALGDLTNALGKRLVPPPDLEKNVGGNKVSRVDESLFSCGKEVNFVRRFDQNADNVEGRMFEGLVDGALEENFLRPSIFRGSKVQHMAAEAAVQLAKEVGGRQHPCLSLDSSVFDDKEESSLELEGDCENEEEDDMDCEFLGTTAHGGLNHFGSLESAASIVSKEKADDGECLTQEQIAGSSENLKPSGLLDHTIGGDLPCSNVEHAAAGHGGSEAGFAWGKLCDCSFCLKASFMWTDLHYQDARGRFAALKKSRRIAKLLAVKNNGNECAVHATGDKPKRNVGMELELAQQRKSLFSHTEDVLAREAAQLHSTLVKLKELRDNCKRDLQMITNSSLEK